MSKPRKRTTAKEEMRKSYRRLEQRLRYYRDKVEEILSKMAHYDTSDYKEPDNGEEQSDGR